MHANTTRRFAQQRGFTLIEIMVVVVIIGLLAAIVAPNFIGNIDTAQVNAAKQDIRQIETAMNLFRLDNFRYPTTEEGIEALVRNPGGNVEATWKQYLPRVPLDPWNNRFEYENPGQHGGEFDLYSFGRDGQEGGEGIDADIGNWALE
jgi:general secretion pathway protein G